MTAPFLLGSPYHPRVVDSRKVRIIGGWQHFMDSNERLQLTVGERKQLPFDISEAGPGRFIVNQFIIGGPHGRVVHRADNFITALNHLIISWLCPLLLSLSTLSTLIKNV